MEEYSMWNPDRRRRASGYRPFLQRRSIEEIKNNLIEDGVYASFI